MAIERLDYGPSKFASRNEAAIALAVALWATCADGANMLCCMFLLLA